MKKEKKPDGRTNLAERLAKQNVEVPVQQVELFKLEPINKPQATRSRTKMNEAQLNIHIDVDLLKRLKVKGIGEDKSLKQMISEAIVMYLK